MCDFSFECGMVTVSWCAEFALRRRVSMSAIGSVIVMGSCPSSPGYPDDVTRLRGRRPDLRRSCYQLLLDTPGSSPRWAISRTQIRHRPNLRYTECGRPHRWHRVY